MARNNNTRGNNREPMTLMEMSQMNQEEPIKGFKIARGIRYLIFVTCGFALLSHFVMLFEYWDYTRRDGTAPIIMYTANLFFPIVTIIVVTIITDNQT